MDIPSSPAVQREPGAGVPLSQSTDMGPSHRLFASCLEATQMHTNDPGRSNKSCQWHKTTCTAAFAFTLHSTSATHPHNSQSHPRMLNPLLTWPTFGASAQQWLCPSQPHLPTAGAAVTSAEAPRPSLPRALSTATSTHPSWPATPPEGLRTAVPGCWSSLRTQGAASSPAPALERIHPQLPRGESKHAPSTTDLPGARAPLHPREAHGLLLSCAPAKAWNWALHQDFYLRNARNAPEPREGAEKSQPSTSVVLVSGERGE